MVTEPLKAPPLGPVSPPAAASRWTSDWSQRGSPGSKAKQGETLSGQNQGQAPAANKLIKSRRVSRCFLLICFEVDWISGISWMILEKLETEVVLRCFGFLGSLLCASVFCYSLAAPQHGWEIQPWFMMTSRLQSNLYLWLCQNSYWKLPFIADLPMINADFSMFFRLTIVVFHSSVSLPESIPSGNLT